MNCEKDIGLSIPQVVYKARAGEIAWEYVEHELPCFVRDKILYDEIMTYVTTSDWLNDDYKCFIDFYKGIIFSLTSYPEEYRKSTRRLKSCRFACKENFLPHPIRNGHGRQERQPHRFHYSRGLPIHKVQFSAEYEEVMNYGYLRKNHAVKVAGKRCEPQVIQNYKKSINFLFLTRLI